MSEAKQAPDAVEFLRRLSSSIKTLGIIENPGESILTRNLDDVADEYRDLVAACKIALDCLIDGNEDDGEAGEALRAALSKAKGE